MGLTPVGLPPKVSARHFEKAKGGSVAKCEQRGSDPGSVKSCAEEVASGFECNICLSTAENPAVTLCGHLFCWNCIRLWSRNKQGGHRCPVCKAGLELERVITICHPNGKGAANHPRSEGKSAQGARGLGCVGTEGIWSQLSFWGNVLGCNIALFFLEKRHPEAWKVARLSTNSKGSQ